MSVSIKVRYVFLTKAAEEMRNLGSSMGSRTLKVQMGNSKGDFQKELTQLASDIEAVGLAFAEIANATATALDNAKAGFMAADEKAAGLYIE